MVRRVVLTLLSAGFLALSVAGIAHAHTLAKDGKISAFLHIAPDDKPQPGKVNTVHFYFNDQDFRFTMEGCFCNASVKEDNKVLFKGSLTAEDIRVGKLNVFLPDNNKSYDVIVSGAPKTAGFFQPFKLKFDIDVGNPPPETVPSGRSWTWAVVIIAVLCAVASIAYRVIRSRLKWNH